MEQKSTTKVEVREIEGVDKTSRLLLIITIIVSLIVGTFAVVEIASNVMYANQIEQELNSEWKKSKNVEDYVYKLNHQ